MRNSIYFRWFMESLRPDQVKDYNSYSINEQKNWYISYLEERYGGKEKDQTQIKLDKKAKVLFIYNSLINDDFRYFEFIAEFEGLFYLCNGSFDVLDIKQSIEELKETHGISEEFLTKL